MGEEATFGRLLKRYRRAAHLTQAELAELAGYSSHYVSMLERGVRSPQPLTIDLLADALPLGAQERAELHAAAEAGSPLVGVLAGIPTPSISLIGRQDEMARIVDILGEGDVRLLTLTGPGGVGKTLLAQYVASTLAPALRDGGVFVDLTALTDPADVTAAIARALVVRQMAGRSIYERLVEFLRGRETLLVLDCFERVVEAATVLSDLLIRCPDLKLLVTSRVPLRLRSEHEFRLEPLALAGIEQIQHGLGLLQSPAIAMFVQRAKLVRSELEIDEAQAPIVADICRRVDGLPLAIELAAARITHLPLGALRARLQHQLEILTGGSRDLPTRQRRMRDTIAWSYDLLTAPEQTLFRRLSVFTGSWSLEGAEQVCGQGHDTGYPLDGLRALVESSLVIASDAPGEPRYRMLDTIHEFASEELKASGELDAMRERHSAYYVHLAKQAEPALQDRDQQIWYTRLELEHDNLRAALQWLLQAGDAESVLRLGGTLWRFWQRHSDIREGRRWLDEGLARGEQVPGHVRAKALWGAGWLAYYQGDYARARELSIEHLALARGQEDPLSTRNALTGLGMAALAEGKHDEAAPLLREALDVCMPLGNIWHRATSFLNLGNAMLLAGDLTRAAGLFQEALALYEARGDDVFVARTRQHLGYVSLLQGEYRAARMLFAQSLQALFELGEKPGVADGLEAVAAVHAATGKAREAAELVEAGSVLRDSIGVAPLPYLRRVWYPFVSRAQSSLSDADWVAAREKGRGMSLEEAVAIAVSEDGRH